MKGFLKRVVVMGMVMGIKIKIRIKIKSGYFYLNCTPGIRNGAA